MAEGWISCINCSSRFRVFIRFCPNCGSENPFYNRPPTSKNRFRKKAGKKAIVFAASITAVVIISILLLLNAFTKNNGSNLSNGLHVENPRSLEIQRQPNIAVDNSLLQYALNKINEDRARFNLPPVQPTACSTQPQ
jgi:hypothetical protein